MNNSYKPNLKRYDNNRINRNIEKAIEQDLYNKNSNNVII